MAKIIQFIIRSITSLAITCIMLPSCGNIVQLLNSCNDVRDDAVAIDNDVVYCYYY